MLEPLRHRLIASCQPVPGGPMDRPEIVVAMAEAALAGGAAGLRIEGLDNVRAVRSVCEAPIVGLVKRDLNDSSVRITAHGADAAALVVAGADIVAVDATDRARPEPLADVLRAVREAGALALADCATATDGERARALGFDVLASTLSGYVGPGAPPTGPDLALVGELATHSAFVFAEGRYHRPEEAAAAIAAGAFAVVVGTALTRLEHVAGWFADAIERAATTPRLAPTG